MDGLVQDCCKSIANALELLHASLNWVIIGLGNGLALKRGQATAPTNDVNSILRKKLWCNFNQHMTLSVQESAFKGIVYKMFCFVQTSAYQLIEAEWRINASLN